MKYKCNHKSNIEVNNAENLKIEEKKIEIFAGKNKM